MKFLNVRFLCYFFLIAIVASMIIHWFNLAARKSDIDKLEIALRNIKPLIPNDRKISFRSNQTENSPQLELYFQSQFVMCPVILSEKQKDTFLLVQRKGKDFLEIEDVDTIALSEAYDLNVLLLKKKKP